MDGLGTHRASTKDHHLIRSGLAEPNLPNCVHADGAHWGTLI
ncbi:hypothetical protein PoMZ_06724 [Pyricularia oryzae]|uniref:Uncharacterized protein n=1 Tax=Pyricularia oryzae TaxID=318829 RepID=A0A4P7NRG2_PYROR|nr:hypothetical protein PoMZ_06724 [Pyricularia oryzae]